MLTIEQILLVEAEESEPEVQRPELSEVEQPVLQYLKRKLSEKEYSKLLSLKDEDPEKYKEQMELHIPYWAMASGHPYGKRFKKVLEKPKVMDKARMLEISSEIRNNAVRAAHDFFSSRRRMAEFSVGRKVDKGAVIGEIHGNLAIYAGGRLPVKKLERDDVIIDFFADEPAWGKQPHAAVVRSTVSFYKKVVGPDVPGKVRARQLYTGEIVGSQKKGFRKIEIPEVEWYKYAPLRPKLMETDLRYPEIGKKRIAHLPSDMLVLPLQLVPRSRITKEWEQDDASFLLTKSPISTERKGMRPKQPRSEVVEQYYRETFGVNPIGTEADRIKEISKMEGWAIEFVKDILDKLPPEAKEGRRAEIEALSKAEAALVREGPDPAEWREKFDRAREIEDPTELREFLADWPKDMLKRLFDAFLKRSEDIEKAKIAGDLYRAAPEARETAGKPSEESKPETQLSRFKEIRSMSADELFSLVKDKSKFLAEPIEIQLFVLRTLGTKRPELKAFTDPLLSAIKKRISGE